MANTTEVGVGYVNLEPSMKGFGAKVTTGLGTELSGPMTRSGEEAGKGFTTGLSNALGKTSGALSGIGSKMSVALTAPLLGFGVKAVGMASTLNESISKSNAVFGSSAAAIEQFANGAANNLGLAKAAALDAAGGFGNMFQQLGIATPTAADMSQKIIGLAADFSSFNDVPVDQVLEAQSAAFRGEYDSLQRFLPLVSAATVEQEALKETHKKSAKELTANDKAMATYQLMLQGAGAAQGDFARTADQDANATRRASAQATNAAAAFGEKLLPVKMQLIKAASSLLGWFNKLSPSQQNLALKAVVVAAALGPVLKIVGGVTGALGNLFKVSSVLGKGVVSAFEFAPKVISSVSGIAQSFGSLIASAAQAAAGIVRAGIEMVISAVRATASVVASIATQIAAWVVMGVQALIAAAQVALAWLISMGPIVLVGLAVVALVALIVTHFDLIKHWVSVAFQFIWDVIQGFWSWLSSNWPLVLGIILGPLGLAIAWIIQNWGLVSAAFSAVVGAIGAGVTAIVGFFTGLWGRAVGGWTALQNGANAVASAIASWVGDRVTAIVGFFVGIWGRISGAYNFLQTTWNAGMTAIVDWARGRVDAIVSFFIGMPGRIGAAMEAVADRFSGPFTRAFDLIRSAWNRTVGGFGVSIPSPFPGVPGIHLSIPRMHTGGIFAPDSGSEGLALLKRGEGVFTPEQMSALGQGQGTTPAATGAVVELVAAGLDRALFEWLRSAIRGKGGNVQLALGQTGR